MFDLFKKRKSKFEIVSPVKGKLIRITKVPDKVFASKVMGDGFALEPIVENDKFTVTAPVAGKVVSLPSSKHAIGIHTKNGIDVLVHIGIDTVNLKEEGFTAFVKEGDKIKEGERVISVDEEILTSNNLNDDVMVIFTNGYNKNINLDDKYDTNIEINEKLLG